MADWSGPLPRSGRASATAYGDRLDEPEAADRPGGEPSALPLRGGQALAGRPADAQPVAACDLRQPGGQVDRRAEDVAEPLDDRTARQPEAYVRHLGVAADHVDDPLGDSDAVLRSPGYEQHGVAEALDDPAGVARDDVL